MKIITHWVPISSKPKNIGRLITRRPNSMAYQGTDAAGVEYYRKKDGKFFLHKRGKWYRLERTSV